jgi:hypothetical protein
MTYLQVLETPGGHLDRVSTGSAIATWSVRRSQESPGVSLLVTYQVATAPCTDTIQEAGYGHGNKPT